MVLTKKDEFWYQHYGKAQELFANLAQKKGYAGKELRKRVFLIEKELLDIKDGRCDSVVALSKGA